MTNILLINTNLSWNKGSAAQVICTADMLRNLDKSVGFSLMSLFPSFDIKYSKKYDIRVIGYFSSSSSEPFIYFKHILLSLLRCIIWKLFSGNNFSTLLLNDRYLKAYSEADIIIDLSGDSFTDAKLTSLLNCINMFPGIVFGKPLILFSQSIGPFRRLSYPIIRFCLSKSSLITARGEITKRYLESMQINTPIFLVADCAFVLKPASPQRVQEILQNENISVGNKPLIGISVNTMLDDEHGRYINLMAQICDYIIDNFDAQIILISHSFRPTEDDRVIAAKVHEKATNKNQISIVRYEYSPEELKGIIGRCAVFIGARMHSNIAALSQCIPTIAVPWNHKYYEIMKSLGQAEYIYSIKKNGYNFKNLTLKIDRLWYNRHKISKELAITIKTQKKMALLSGQLVKEFIAKKMLL